MLIWNMLHSILLVASSASLKVPEFNSICSRCSLHEEDHLHLFRDCASSMVMWNMIFENFPQNNEFAFTNFSNALGKLT